MQTLTSKLEFLSNSEINFDNKSIIAVVDEIVLEKYNHLITQWLPRSKILSFAAREENKNLSFAEKIYMFFQRQKINRDSIILAVGGGITSDITGYCVATYMRGCKLWIMPTTFVAMIDAAIGGKTGINFNEVKNNIGTFYPAEKIIINSDFLESLQEIDINNGWSECVKAALLMPDLLYEAVKNSDKKITKVLLENAINVKLHYVTNDLTDKSKRRFLNLGHTFGHVLESITHYKLAHGTAVAIGMRMAIKISRHKELISNSTMQKMLDLLDRFNFPQKLDMLDFKANSLQIENILLLDKKASHQEDKIIINVILFQGWGDPLIVKMPVEELIAYFEDFLPPNSYFWE